MLSGPASPCAPMFITPYPFELKLVKILFIPPVVDDGAVILLLINDDEQIKLFVNVFNPLISSSILFVLSTKLSSTYSLFTIL